jgi:hypothetical protein
LQGNKETEGKNKMRKLAILGNVIVSMALLYTLVINGLLTVWADENGIGFSINTYKNPCGGDICD